jgi:hypothetical protein
MDPPGLTKRLGGAARRLRRQLAGIASLAGLRLAISISIFF